LSQAIAGLQCKVGHGGAHTQMGWGVENFEAVRVATRLLRAVAGTGGGPLREAWRTGFAQVEFFDLAHKATCYPPSNKRYVHL
jgi:hypothetical protein